MKASEHLALCEGKRGGATESERALCAKLEAAEKERDDIKVEWNKWVQRNSTWIAEVITTQKSRDDEGGGMSLPHEEWARFFRIQGYFTADQDRQLLADYQRLETRANVLGKAIEKIQIALLPVRQTNDLSSIGKEIMQIIAESMKVQP